MAEKPVKYRNTPRQLYAAQLIVAAVNCRVGISVFYKCFSAIYHVWTTIFNSGGATLYSWGSHEPPQPFDFPANIYLFSIMNPLKNKPRTLFAPTDQLSLLLKQHKPFLFYQHKPSFLLYAESSCDIGHVKVYSHNLIS